MSACLGTVASNAQAALTPQQQLGKFLYFDEELSEPAGQSCASCHHPDAGFADPDTHLPVSEGVIPGRFGGRNSPSAAYAVFFPEFSYNDGVAVGGQFWDGRAANLTEQAKGPFLNPVEMNNPNKETVLADVQASSYIALFEQICGPTTNTEAAYNCLAASIADYEGTNELNQFTSKFDYVQAGLASFTRMERRGQELFDSKGRCAECHTLDDATGPDGATVNALFTDFRYYNLGLPKNTEFPMTSNPVDLGLGGELGVAAENGKFKNPHLRNIALTPPYMHNGVLKTLREVVHFYNTRDIPGMWDAPEVPENIETERMGNLGLSHGEEEAIVAFLMTLTDGYDPAADGGTGGGGHGGGGPRR